MKISAARCTSKTRRAFPGVGSVLLLIVVIILFSSKAFPQTQIQLAARTVMPSMATTDECLKALDRAPSGSQHCLATFRSHLSREDRKSLESSGIHVVEHFKGNTYWVSIEKRMDMDTAKAMELGALLVFLRGEDRVDPRIWQKQFNRFFVTPPGKKPVNYLLNDDGTLNLTVRFLADTPTGEAEKVLKRYAVKFTKKSNVSWVAVVPKKIVEALAAEDLVQWIDAGPPPFLPENDNTRVATKVESVQNFISGQVTGLEGDGVRVGVFDFGIESGNSDFDSRVVDHAGVSDHGNKVAGTLAGNGSQSDLPCSKSINGADHCVSGKTGKSGSALQWRGMAPKAVLLDQLYEDGNSAVVHLPLIAPPGMHLTNHSYVRYGVDLDGAYTTHDQDLDGIILGTTVANFPRLGVISAGNRGMSCTDNSGAPVLCSISPYQQGYFSLTKQLKNGLVVGDWNYWGPEPDDCLKDPPPDPASCPRNKIAQESSLGPAHDGRIKPDVVAPGEDVWSPCFPVPTDPNSCPRPPFYGSYSGTSAAAAAVTGSLALVLEQYAKSYPADPNHPADLNQVMPLPSTLRAVMIHTACDIDVDNAGNLCTNTSTLPDPWFSNADGPVRPTKGPDFVTGWGMIDAVKATNVVASRLLTDDGTLTSECDVKTYAFSVEAAQPVRVTLAWDDLPYNGDLSPPHTDPATGNLIYPYVDPRLENDLDLILLDPNGQSHYSWKLDQKIVDASDNEVADALQSCTTSVRVDRQFVPTHTPDLSNDTIPDGGVPVAVKGRDHLNNVEVVDVDSPSVGVWLARVIGFSFPMGGPQRFSLVGYDFVDVSIPPPIVCHVNHLVCKGLAFQEVCKFNPSVCTAKIVIPVRGIMPVQFGSFKERIFTPLNRSCGRFVDCTKCAVARECPRYMVGIKTTGIPLVAEVYSAQGELIAHDVSTEHARQLSFDARPGEDYVLVMSPGDGIELGRQYKVAIRVD